MTFREILKYIFNEVPPVYQGAALRYSIGLYLLVKLILEAEKDD